MRMIHMAVLGLWACILSGCASQVGGTWVADQTAEPKSPIAKVSFCEDGTFTAHAEYGDHRSHTGSGRYEYRKGMLTLDAEGSIRSYNVKVEGDHMHITFDGKTYHMNRLK